MEFEEVGSPGGSFSPNQFTFGFWDEKIRGTTYGGRKTLNKIRTNRDNQLPLLKSQKAGL